MNDQELIDRTLQGSAEAFGGLVTRYQDRLYRHLLVVTGKAEDAEEVAQEAFVLAYQKLSSFRGRSQLYTWIYRIAINLWISRRRKKSSQMPPQSLHGAAFIEPSDTGPCPADQVLRAEQVGQVRAALSQLPEEYRTILVLRELDDCDYETIAEMLDVPVGTVRSRLHRARLNLKEVLERTLGNESCELP